MNKHPNLTDEAIVVINVGLMKLANVELAMLDWHRKLIALGFDVDDMLFHEVLSSMREFSFDISAVCEQSRTKNQIEALRRKHFGLPPADLVH